MKTSAFYALAAANMVAGHATFQSIVVGGKDQGQHFAVRTPSNGNNPILDVTSTAMICNGGKKMDDQEVEVAAGSEITFQWHHNDPMTTSGDTDEPIAASHKGPVMVYIAKADTEGEGAVWTKIYEDGLSNGKWAVDTFIANKGAITITLPNLSAGSYLIRPEIIALHEGDRKGGAQFYNGCGQIKVTGSGSAELPASGTDMTKAYSAEDPGVLFNMYGGATTYEIPGPAVWDGASSGGSGSGSSPAPATSAPVNTAAPTPTATSIAENEVPSATATGAASSVPAPPVSTAAPAPPTSTGDYGSGSGSTLPEKFTIEEFISWLEQTTSPANARRFARSIGRAHARAFL